MGVSVNISFLSSGRTITFSDFAGIWADLPSFFLPPIYLLFSRWWDDAALLHSSPSPPPCDCQIFTDQVNLSIFSSCSKYFIASNCPTSHCFLRLIASVSSLFVLEEKERLFPAFVALVWAITSGWDERKIAHLRAVACTMGFWTVWNRCRSRIPVWCSVRPYPPSCRLTPLLFPPYASPHVSALSEPLGWQCNIAPRSRGTAAIHWIDGSC